MSRNERAAPSLPPSQGRSLRGRFTRLLVLAVALPSLLFAALQLVDEYRSERQRMREQLEATARLSASAVDQYIEAQRAGVAMAAALASKAGRRPDLEVLRAQYPGLSTSIATDRDGRVVDSSPRLPRAADLLRLDDRDDFRVPATTGAPYVSGAVVGRVFGDTPLVVVSAPLVGEDGFQGVIEGAVDIDRFTTLRAAALHARGLELLIVDADDRVIFASGALGHRFGQSLRGQAYLAGGGPAAGVTHARLYDAVLRDGGDAWGVRAPLRTGWQLMLFAPQRPVLERMGGRALAAGGMLLLAVAGALVVAAWRMRVLTRAVGRVLAALGAMADGRRDVVLGAGVVPRELRPVAHGIEQLSARLDAADRELRAALEQQRALATSLQGVVEAREREIAERTVALKAANAELERLSRTDALTGALNVRGFRELTDRLAPQGTLERAVAVLVFDIDYFKRYNDRYGHPAGDRVLRRVVGAAQAQLRDTRDQVARTGGEEFVALLPDADLPTALAVAERMRAAVAALEIPHEGSPAGRLGMSLGVVAALPGELLDTVMQLADEALYRAKHAGRDRVST